MSGLEFQECQARKAGVDWGHTEFQTHPKFNNNIQMPQILSFSKAGLRPMLWRNQIIHKNVRCCCTFCKDLWHPFS